MFSLDSINQLLIDYRYLIFFPLMVVEGPIVTVIAGYLAFLGYFNVYEIMILALLGDLVGDFICYFFGRFGRASIIKKWGYYIGISWDKVEDFEKLFHKHAIKTLLIGKALHGVGVVPLISAGVVKYDAFKFAFWNIVPTIPKSLILFYLGYHFGKNIEQTDSVLKITALVTILAFIGLVMIYVGKKYTEKYIKKDL